MCGFESRPRYYATVVEPVDTADLKSAAARRAGSTPASGTVTVILLLLPSNSGHRRTAMGTNTHSSSVDTRKWALEQAMYITIRDHELTEVKQPVDVAKIIKLAKQIDKFISAGVKQDNSGAQDSDAE